MSPLDDQLRAAMHARADDLTPSPDPLAGIESRARGIRRRRLAASVAGAALAVSAIAVAVPALRSSPTRPARPAQLAATSSATLDPAHPWALRGTPLPAATLATFRRDWATKHPGSTLTPLFSEIYESAGQPEAAFVASGPDGDRYGFVSASASGSAFPVDLAYGEQRALLLLTVPGDEVSRVLAVAAPTSRLVISHDGGKTTSPMTAPAPGVGIAPLEGSLQVTAFAADGKFLALDSAEATGSSPTNLVDWPARGTQDSTLLAAARTAAAPTLPGTGEVLLQVLFEGATDSQVRYVTGQVWRRGDAQAHSFSYTSSGSTFFGPVTPKDPQVLAFLINGSPTDLLVVIPAPRTSQVSYGTDRFHVKPVPDTPGTDGVALIARSRTPGTDVLVLLTGNGGPDEVSYNGPVAELLCGDKGCG